MPNNLFGWVNEIFTTRFSQPAAKIYDYYMSGKYHEKQQEIDFTTNMLKDAYNPSVKYPMAKYSAMPDEKLKGKKDPQTGETVITYSFNALKS